MLKQHVHSASVLFCISCSVVKCLPLVAIDGVDARAPREESLNHSTLTSTSRFHQRCTRAHAGIRVRSQP